MGLGKALRRGAAHLSESRSGISPVYVDSSTHLYIFAMAGEVLLGGYQNRMVAHDTLIRPHAQRYPLHVYCSERHRWDGRGTTFNRSEILASPKMRHRLHSDADQDEVWRGIAGELGRSGVHSETEDYERSLSAPRIDRWFREYDPVIRRVLRPETVGVAFLRDGMVLSVDLFCSHELLRELWPKLLRSSLLEAGPSRGWGSRRYEPDRGRDVVERFLDNAGYANYGYRHQGGEGRVIGISGSGVGGSALLFHNDVVHCQFFPAVRIAPVIPRPEPPWRQERHRPHRRIK